MPQTSTLADLVIAIHFESDIPLTVLDLADWTREFGAEFPTIQQSPALGRINLVTNPFELVPAPELPLMGMASIDGKLYLKLQPDRFAFGWSRKAPAGTPDTYPGFADMMDRWHDLIHQFEAWLATRSGLSGFARLVELSYVNTKPLPTDVTKAVMSDTFAFLKRVGRTYNGFQMQWTELLEINPLAARVNAEFVLGSIHGQQPALLFNFVGLAPVAGRITGPEPIAAIETLHARIIDMFEATIISDRL